MISSSFTLGLTVEEMASLEKYGYCAIRTMITSLTTQKDQVGKATYLAKSEGNKECSVMVVAIHPDHENTPGYQVEILKRI